MSETLTFIINNYQVTEPTPADAIAFVDDITNELDPTTIDDSKTMEYFREAKHYKSSLSYDDKSYPDMSYAVIKMYDHDVPIYMFFCTNDWDVDYNFNPFDPVNYPETYRAIMGQMTSASIQPSGGYVPDTEFSGRFEVVMTKNPDGEPEPTPTKSEPEAYPSIERSLDKIVDKMEGNTAAEVFKEAVPSVEKSLWKIADLFEAGSKEDDADDEEPTEIIYDKNNVNRYILNLNYISHDLSNYRIHDSVKSTTITYSQLCENVKKNPFSIRYFSANLSISGSKMTFSRMNSSFSYVDENGAIHSLIEYSVGTPIGDQTTFYDCFILGEIVINSNDNNSFFLDSHELHAIASERTGGAIRLIHSGSISLYNNAN